MVSITDSNCSNTLKVLQNGVWGLWILIFNFCHHAFNWCTDLSIEFLARYRPVEQQIPPNTFLFCVKVKKEWCACRATQ